MNYIKSYPFTGCSSEKIKKIADRISILYYKNGDFDVYFGGEVVDGKVKNVLCYFLFLARQIEKFNKSKSKGVYSVNTYLDTILMTINEFISLGKTRNLSLNQEDILVSINQYSDDDNYRYLSSVIEMLMDDCYCVDVHSGKSCIKYDTISDGELSDEVSNIIDNEYGFSKKKICI